MTRLLVLPHVSERNLRAMRRTYSLKVCPFCATRYFSDDRLCSTDESNSISKLSDDVLLEIFDHYRKDHYNNPRPLLVWKWHILAHVCKRWRQLVFSSPRRLDLQILCTFGTPFREDLGIWPALPIVLDLYSPGFPFTPNDEDNAIAALEHSDRLCSISLYVTGSMWAKMPTVLRKPFPLLKRFKFVTVGLNVPALPDEFLGGSAPCLQEFYLSSIPFPALPTLLLTTSKPRQPHSFHDAPDWLHSTRDDGCVFGRVAPPRTLCHRIQ